MRRPGALQRRTRGFTLIELAIALFIITLVLGSLLVPLTTQVVQRKTSDTQKSLDEINESLTGFAIANGHLPCPAISETNGLEARTLGACTDGRRQGYLPWTTLSVSKLDAWGHIFRYSVTLAYASSSLPFNLATLRDITIRTRDASGGPIDLTNGADIPAVVLSHGSNGYGSVNDQGVAVALPSDWPESNTYTDEKTNGGVLGNQFVSRVPQGAGTPITGPGRGGEFDDIVVSLSPYILFKRMIAAGKLP